MKKIDQLFTCKQRTSSKLERICAGAFSRTSIESLSIPDGVVELSDGCFYECESLRSVLFGASSKLERICYGAFSRTSIESLSIPDGVVELGGQCSLERLRLCKVVFGVAVLLERVDKMTFSFPSIETVLLVRHLSLKTYVRHWDEYCSALIPDSVEVGEKRFCKCNSVLLTETASVCHCFVACHFIPPALQLVR